MIRSSAWPSASSAVNPNIRSAAGFHSRIFPSVSAAMIASPAACTRDYKSSVECMEDLRSHAAHKRHNGCMKIAWHFVVYHVAHEGLSRQQPHASGEPPPKAGARQELSNGLDCQGSLVCYA